ncbi:MAG: dTDP-4-dehydrorhamnose 3,5-epimerase [Candidatus Desulfofervidaceae bacterium]|nr:dTDP-4-dehydrorhamnose 3,5-epimerase [Candidatus Desulfofervidaceae bacterium]
MPFNFIPLELPGVILIEPKVFSDERGFFMEVYKSKDFATFGITDQFVQDNHSCSAKGVLRGLHYQKHPMAQTKLVRCIKGAIFDVAVDIRKGSPTYGKWVGVTLSADNKKMLYIPVGFAHGFFTLEDETEVIYKVSNFYSPENECGIIWNDPQIGIRWPSLNPILSERDKKWPLLANADNNFIFEGVP